MDPQVFDQALQHLLPRGAAWPRDPGSVWMAVIHGTAGSFAELQAFIEQTAREWLPQITHTRLAEWEEAVGLPDPCIGPLADDEQRRAAILTRLRGYVGAYADSSPAAPGALQAFCTSIGIPATVFYRRPFRCGKDRVGTRLGANDGKLFFYITGPLSAAPLPFRVGQHRVGRRLVVRAPEIDRLLCALRAIVPARFSIELVLP